MATIHAVITGTDIINKEERDKTTEFLFVKPISRTRIITSKLLAGVLNVIVLNIVTLFSSYYFVSYFGKTNSVNHDIDILMIGLLFLQLLFFFVGFSIAAASHKPKSSPAFATSILLFTFILSFLINVNTHLDILKYLTPFKYFDAKTLMSDGRLDPIYITISLVLMFSMAIYSYRTYASRDLNV
jgi:ABC-2 type transport system permease protein